MNERKIRVLLFDDDPDQRAALRSGLEADWISIVVPETKEATLDEVLQHPEDIALVFVDYHFHPVTSGSVMQGTSALDEIRSGLELTERIFRINPKIPIVLYTAAEEDAPDEKKAMSMGAYRVIVEGQIADLVEELRDLIEIVACLREIQDSRKSMGHVVARLGVGFQVVDTRGRIWFRDEAFQQIVGESSGRPYEICYCKTHGYSLEHGICQNCLIHMVEQAGDEGFRIFFSPTYPDGPGSQPVFKYLSVKVSPIRRRHRPGGTCDRRKGQLAETGELIGVIEAVSAISYSSVMQSMGLREHLETLARALGDVGFCRARIYRTTRVREGDQTHCAIKGFVFNGPVEDGVVPADLVHRLDDEPVLEKSETGRLAKVLSPDSEYLNRSPEVSQKLLIREGHPPLAVALFDGAGSFIGWIELDNALDLAGAPTQMRAAKEEDLFPQRNDQCIPPSPMRIMEQIARVLASTPMETPASGAGALQAEHAFEKIRMRVATHVDAKPSELLANILKAVKEEVPGLSMAHVRRIVDQRAVSLASVGDYGLVAEKEVDTRTSMRMTALVARTAIPEIWDDIRELGHSAPGFDEFTPEQREIIFKHPSHAVYSLLMEGEVIGTVSFQSLEVAFFKGYRRQVFRMVTDLLAGALRDYLGHLRDVRAVGAEIGQQAALLVIHNVNQPVSTIRACVELAKGDLETSAGVAATLTKRLDIIDEQCLRIAGIRTDFLKLFGPGSRRLERIDSHKALHSVTDEATRDQPEIDVTFDLDEGLRALYTEPRAVEVVLTVLVRNSIDALRHTSGKRTLQIALRRVREDSATERGFARCIAVDVVDDGPGVSQENESRLFEPFESDKPGGLGIGLAYARQMVLRMGGEVYYAKDDPRGTRFTALLPARLET